MKVVISTTSFGELDARPLQFLKNAGCEVVLNPYGRTLTGDEVAALAGDAVGLIAGTEPLDRSVLGKLRCLRCICRLGAGMENVDLSAARELNIKVDNTPSGPTLAVAELTVGLILDLLRRSTRMDREMRACIWKKRMGNLLSGKKVGIIGFGRIGRKTAELLSAFGCEISYYDTADVAGCVSTKIKKLDLVELLRTSDIITIHVSGKYETPLIGQAEFNRMKEGAWIINVARGGVVDEEALCDALKKGRLAGAALDVFCKEPYDGSLRELENVILTPHIGSYAREARIEMEMEAAQKLIEGLAERGIPDV